MEPTSLIDAIKDYCNDAAGEDGADGEYVKAMLEVARLCKAMKKVMEEAEATYEPTEEQCSLSTN